MRRVLAAAAVYAGAVFALGFVIGTLRVLVLVPAIGPVAAVLVELPVMIGASVVLARRVIRRRGVPDDLGSRAVMGAVAFVLLMAAEIALGVWGFGLAPGEILAGFATPAGALGLAGQVAFGLVPLVVLRR